MSLPFSFYSVAGMKCKEMAEASVAIGFQRSYELMFLNSLHFYIKPQYRKYCIATRIGCPKNRFEKDLERYHGIKGVKYNRLFHQNPINFVVKSLNEPTPQK